MARKRRPPENGKEDHGQEIALAGSFAGSFEWTFQRRSFELTVESV